MINVILKKERMYIIIVQFKVCIENNFISIGSKIHIGYILKLIKDILEIINLENNFDLLNVFIRLVDLNELS